MADSDIPTSHKIIAFILTLIAIPLLFVFTCVPVGLVSLAGAQIPNVTTIIFVLYGVVFVGVGLWIAIRTPNPGIRWGIIAALAVAAVYAAITYVPGH
ncbi:MAG: hypothetical protein KGJ78_05010 [Alphaproteobacteria bacterium]|nr:hypothetical protein [Alphaproteobacteria bacterium]